MNLKKTIVIVFTGIIYMVILKLSKFLFPGAFNSILVIKTVHILSFLSGISVILFGMYFMKEVNGKDNLKLNLAVFLAMIGPIYYTCRHIAGILIKFNGLSLKVYDFSPGLHQAISSFSVSSYSQFIFWLSSIFVFSFFYLLYKNLSTGFDGLSKAIRFVLYGTILTVVFRSFSLFVYLFLPNSILIHNPPMIIHLLGFMIFLFSSLVLLHFLIKLYQIEDNTSILKI